MDNILLRIASVVGKLVVYLLYLCLVLIVIGLGYVLLSGDTEVFSMITFTDSGFILSTGDAQQASPPPSGLLLFYGVKAIFAIVCYLFIFRESLNVIASIKSLETFRQDNIKSFRRIGQLFAVLFLLSTVQISRESGEWTFTLLFEPSYLLGTLVAFILAEIFREGNHLMEEQKLTI